MSAKATPTIEPINQNEQAWIKGQLDNALKFVEGFTRADKGQSVTLATLDEAFAAWLASAPSDVDLINAIVNYVGIAFGQALVDGIGFQWVIATDEYGSDLAVHCLPKQGDVLVYPANFVAKRWERREANFLQNAYQQIANDVGRISQEWQLT